MSREMLVVMDPPRHTGYRKPVVPCFKPKSIGELEASIRTICRDIMNEAREAGPEVDFVHQVSGKMPTRVMGQLMGLPEADWPRCTSSPSGCWPGRTRSSPMPMITAH